MTPALRSPDGAQRARRLTQVREVLLAPLVRRGLTRLGERGLPLPRAVVFTDVRVPRSHLRGREGEGFTIAMRGLNGGPLNIGACSLGGAQWAYEQAVRHVRERVAFGRPLADNQSLVFRLAEMHTRLEAARGLLRRAAHALDVEAADAVELCAMAKGFATDVGLAVANDALQLHGGYAMGRLAGAVYQAFAAGDGAHQDFSGIIDSIRESSQGAHSA